MYRTIRATTLRILLLLALIAAALVSAETYVEYFARSPGLVLAGGLIVFVAWLPSLRVGGWPDL